MAALIKEITICLDWEVVYSEWAPLGPCPTGAFTPPTVAVTGQFIWAHICKRSAQPEDTGTGCARR